VRLLNKPYRRAELAGAVRAALEQEQENGVDAVCVADGRGA